MAYMESVDMPKTKSPPQHLFRVLHLLHLAIQYKVYTMCVDGPKMQLPFNRDGKGSSSKLHCHWVRVPGAVKNWSPAPRSVRGSKVIIRGPRRARRP